MSGERRVEQALEAYFYALLSASQDVQLSEPLLAKTQAQDTTIAAQGAVQGRGVFAHETLLSYLQCLGINEGRL